MYNIHPFSPSLPPLPSRPLPPPSLPPSLPLVTQQIHCPFQPKQSPSYSYGPISRNKDVHHHDYIDSSNIISDHSNDIDDFKYLTWQ